MLRVRLLHWKAVEAAPLMRRLDEGGCRVEYNEKFAPALMKQWRESPPDVFVIDLSRLPSHGREIAVALRQSPGTRKIPIIFYGGSEAKVSAVRAVLPDAVYCLSDASLIDAVKSAKPLENPVKPTPMMNRYEERTVAQKLGIKQHSTIAVLHAPRDCSVILDPLPESTEWVEEEANVTLCFLENVDAVRSEISRLRTVAAHSKLWLLWRKKAASPHTGVTENLVRETALDLGLVDYKICSVNSTWSAMLFALRKEAPPPASQKAQILGL